MKSPELAEILRCAADLADPDGAPIERYSDYLSAAHSELTDEPDCSVPYFAEYLEANDYVIETLLSNPVGTFGDCTTLLLEAALQTEEN